VSCRDSAQTWGYPNETNLSQNDDVIIGTTKGRLLVASPALGDDNFDRTVVFMLEHNDDGALGVIINRPSDEADVEGLESWTELASPPAVVFHGGPVEPDALIGIARTESARDGVGWAPITDSLGTVDLSESPVEIAPVLDAIRIFRGYSGWSPGQLEGELSVNAWIVADANSTDVFDQHPSELWRTVLRRQEGSLRWLANAPDDLSAN
jgi:putative transcriptional regulator